MIANGRTRLWMGLALGSVLVVGLSAGLLADRLLADRGLAERGGADARQSHTARRHDDSASVFHFDCRGWEDGRTGTTGDALTEERSSEVRSEAPSDAAPSDAVLSDAVTSDAARSESLREHRSKVTHRMARRLELDPDQVEALEPIMGEAMERSRRYWTGARDDFCAMQRDFHRQVSELLRPEQAARFDEMRYRIRAAGHPHSKRSVDESSNPRMERERHHGDGHRGRDGHRGEAGNCR